MRIGWSLLMLGCVIAPSRASDLLSTRLDADPRPISFLRTPVSVSEYAQAEIVTSSRDTEILDILEQVDQRNSAAGSGWSRAASVQRLLAQLRHCKRVSLNLSAVERKQFEQSLRLLGLDDDLIKIKERRPSRQAVRTRELLAFLFDDVRLLIQPAPEERNDNVFRTVIKARAELNARAIQKAYDSVMPILLLSFGEFCSAATSQIPRVDDGQIFGSFEFDPPRVGWGSNTAWTSFERSSTSYPEWKVVGEVKRVAINMSPEATALLSFLDQCSAASGEMVPVKTPSGLETIAVQKSVAVEMRELLRSIPSAIFLGRNFRVAGGGPEDENAFSILARTTGSYAFSIEYAR